MDSIQIEKFLDRRHINRWTSKESLDSLISCIKRKKVDQNFFKGLSKGKWLLVFSLVNKNHFKIISSSPENLLLKILENSLNFNSSVSFNVTINFQFWDERNINEKKMFLEKFTKLVDLKIQMYPENDEMSSVEVKLEGTEKWKKLLKFLKESFSYFHSLNLPISSFPYIFLSFKNEGRNIEIELTSDMVEFKGDFDEKGIIKELNKLLICQNKSIPCYYLIYTNIKKVEGKTWKTMVRHGEIVKEYGSPENEKVGKHVEKYNF